MNIKKLFFLIAILAVCYSVGHWFHASPSGSSTNVSGEFISIPLPVGVDAKAVVIYAALNCPRAGARRADELERELTRQGIACSRSNTLEFRVSAKDLPQMEKVKDLMNGEIPLVLVKGRAKNNPSLDEIIKEYKSARN
jgi:hypothetical protein